MDTACECDGLKKQKQVAKKKDESSIIFFSRNETDSSKTRQNKKSVASQLSLMCIFLLLFVFQVTGLQELSIICVSG